MSLFIPPNVRADDSNGNPLSGAKWYFYLTGTTTPTNSYTTIDLTTPHANPVVADSAGKFANIYLDPSVTTRAVLKDSAGNTLFDIDPYTAFVSATDLDFTQSGTGAVTRTQQEKSREIVSPKDFGAVGNGSTNDAAALTAMVSAHPQRFTLGGGLTYRVTSNVPAGLRLLDGKISDSRTIATNDEYSAVFLGWDAGKANTFIPEQHASSGPTYASGNHVVFIGGQAGAANTIGRRQVGIGSRALLSNTTGYYNTAVGSHSMENNTTGFESTAIGTQALGSQTTGSTNTAVGVGAGNKITTATRCVAIGNSSCSGVATGNCTATGFIGIGFQALGFGKTGNDAIAIGQLAAQQFENGDNVICIGGSAGLSLIAASNVVAIGASSLRNSTVGQNCGIGTSTGQAITTGTANFFGGYQAGLVATTADNSVMVGHQAGIAVTTGDDNTFVGKSAGATVTTGGTNTCIGKSADTIAAADNSTSLGNGATCTASNQVTLGNASIATLRCQQTSITALSDQRLKTATKNAFDEGLSFILDVKVRDFKWNAKAGKGLKGRRELGVFAQELHAVTEKHGLGWLGLASPPAEKDGQWEATPGKLLFPLIQAVQELAARNAALEERLAKLERGA